ncbi:type II toxin-antitoxin system ParD family antitoxin [Paracraurococcus lichenis]|uniref:Type II toxin-antitoxin system ParD family antitoxin n=1 Tax=Paracraurococcus lichenis TaxID=3064888 RepID=A0ABT9ECY1_9PROT|nr:type II toxin-antitoxin system ParD family antitoxin [Paracraurococcus sp. LOR1-02]MDO9714069.1 type II toxin-antitoxin system ParD family antitoxin [Paracraurococcus sp. LOR1-02]
MSSTPTRNFSLTPELDRYIREQVTSGHYSSASEVVRAGLRLLIERDHAVPPSPPRSHGSAEPRHSFDSAK